MVHIITDTSALFTVAEGNDMGVHVIPLCVSIQDEHYRDLCFDTSSFWKRFAQEVFRQPHSRRLAMCWLPTRSMVMNESPSTYVWQMVCPVRIRQR